MASESVKKFLEQKPNQTGKFQKHDSAATR